MGAKAYLKNYILGGQKVRRELASLLYNIKCRFFYNIKKTQEKSSKFKVIVGSFTKYIRFLEDEGLEFVTSHSLFGRVIEEGKKYMLFCDLTSIMDEP
jgi:hypothetical protein